MISHCISDIITFSKYNLISHLIENLPCSLSHTNLTLSIWLNVKKVGNYKSHFASELLWINTAMAQVSWQFIILYIPIIETFMSKRKVPSLTWMYQFRYSLQVVSEKVIHFCRQHYEENKNSKFRKTLLLEGLFYWLL